MENKEEKNISRTQIKHKSIIEAAKELFLNLGYNNTSVDAIAKKAVVSKRTIYDHFENKQKLFGFIIVEHWKQSAITTIDLFEEDQSIDTNLTNFAVTFLNFLYQADTINLFRLLISERNNFPDIIGSLLINDKAPFTYKLIEFLQKNKNDGILLIDDTEVAAAHFMGLLKEYHFWPMMLGFTNKKTVDQPELIKNAVEIFVRAYQNK